MARPELRSKRMGDEKSGVGSAGIRRREAVVSFRGPGSRETYEPSPSRLWAPERQQTVHSRVSGARALWEIVRETFPSGWLHSDGCWLGVYDRRGKTTLSGA